MLRSFGMIVVASLALAGCNSADKEELTYDDARNPYYKQAHQDLDNGDAAKAALDYEAALGADSQLAGAHYELGHIYGDKLNDLPGSIFHFEQYLKLAPTGTKADEVKALIDKESQVFASGLPNTQAQSADDYAKLQAENAQLRKDADDAKSNLAQLKSDYEKVLDQLKQATATPAPTAPATPVAAGTDGTTPSTNAVSAVPPRALPLNATNVVTSIPGAEASAGARSYTVTKGDKLWTIAHKMYPGGNTKDNVEKIQEANQQVLGNKPLKIGQVLVIP
jgi:tetratricopeptide (TPR) repeat protein